MILNLTLCFLLKKHFCPKCILQKLKISYTTVEVIRPNKTNINEFKLGKYYFIGEKTIKEPCFYCEKCRSKFSVDEIKNSEKNHRK